MERGREGEREANEEGHARILYNISVGLNLLLPIANSRGNFPTVCSGKPNPSERQSHLGA